MWLDKYFLPAYYPMNDYNDVRLHWTLRQFTQDRSSFRVGPALLRQLRSERGKTYLDFCPQYKFVTQISLTQHG